MSGLKAGENFPEGVSFKYIDLEPGTEAFNTCGIPIAYKASEEWKNKKVAVIGLPGAFTPTCSAAHVPGYVANKAALQAKGIDNVIVLAHNDAFVMSGWEKAHKLGDKFIVFASDENLKFIKSIGWNNDDERSGRFAFVVDHGKIIYAAREEQLQGLEVSSADAVLKNL